MPVLTPKSVYRNWEVDGVPTPGTEHNPKKSEIVQLLEQIQASSLAPAVVRETLADLDLITPAEETYGGQVLNDPDPTNNGYYFRIDGDWVKGRGFPDTAAEFVELEGTANVVVAGVEAGVNPADIKVWFIEPVLTNTDDVVLNGLPVRNVNGDEMAPGEWPAGRLILLVNRTTEWRLLSDPDADGAAASAAASADEAAASALDAIGINWRGAYSGITAYLFGDGVIYDGSSWRALADTSGNAPPEFPSTGNANWDLIARRGVDGAGSVTSLAAGDGLAVDNSDPAVPIISLSGGLRGIACRVVAISNVSISTGIEHGDAIDGVTLASGNLVLLTAQTIPSENGVYVVPASGTATRHASFDTWADFPGSYFPVNEGAVNADTLWYCKSNAGGTLGVTAVTFSEFSTSSTPRGYLYGLTISNNATDAEHDLDITSGGAASDDTVSVEIGLAASITKKSDATFAAGTGNGGMVSGESLPTSGTIHIWAIAKADGTSDVCINNHATSGLAPTLPSGFVSKRRIGSRTTDSSANIVGAIQHGDHVRLLVGSYDVNTSVSGALGTTAILYPIRVPNGLKVEAKIDGQLYHASSQASLLMTSPDETDSSPGQTNNTASLPEAALVGAFQTDMFTDTLGRIRARSNFSSTTFRVYTRGWMDTRGR